MLFTLVGYRKLVRLTSAEAMLARQRERIHQWREAGLDVGKSMALLEVWEQTVEQFRISRRILQSFGLVISLSYNSFSNHNNRANRNFPIIKSPLCLTKCFGHEIIV